MREKNCMKMYCYTVSLNDASRTTSDGLQVTTFLEIINQSNLKDNGGGGLILRAIIVDSEITCYFKFGAVQIKVGNYCMLVEKTFLSDTRSKESYAKERILAG